MAAYVVSIERLALFRRRRLKGGRPVTGSSAATDATPSPFSNASDAVPRGGMRAENSRPAEKPPEIRTPSDGSEESGEFATVQEFLDAPQEQIEAWLKMHGGWEARVLLAMLCRLAALDARLAEIEGRRSAMKILAANPIPTAVRLAPKGGAVKSDLLEEVFQKNLLLRRSKLG